MPERNHSVEPKMLTRLQKWAIVILGLCAFVLGGWSVFANTNAIGSAALIVAGLFLMVLGTTGQFYGFQAPGVSMQFYPPPGSGAVLSEVASELEADAEVAAKRGDDEGAARYEHLAGEISLLRESINRLQQNNANEDATRRAALDRFTKHRKQKVDQRKRAVLNLGTAIKNGHMAIGQPEVQFLYPASDRGVWDCVLHWIDPERHLVIDVLLDDQQPKNRRNRYRERISSLALEIMTNGAATWRALLVVVPLSGETLEVLPDLPIPDGMTIVEWDSTNDAALYDAILEARS